MSMRPDDHRRKWDKTEYQRLAQERLQVFDKKYGKKNLGMSMKVEHSTVDQVKERFQVKKRKLEEKQKDYVLEESLREVKEEEDRYKEQRKQKRKDRKRKHENKENVFGGSLPEEMTVVMGFSGFGG